jgi:PIN domain nuclease of toxin-antitoxin system
MGRRQVKLVLDTCALIWWTLDQQQLSDKVLAVLNEHEVYASSISIWEVGVKVKNKKLDIGMNIKTYLDKLHEISTLKILPVTEEIWVSNLNLLWEHRDPADRTIVATAELTKSWIVTSDQMITSFYSKIFWD